MGTAVLEAMRSLASASALVSPGKRSLSGTGVGTFGFVLFSSSARGGVVRSMRSGCLSLGVAKSDP